MTTQQQGIDYSRDRPAPSAIVAAGKTFVCRYLAYLPNTKVITNSERAALHDAGLGVVFNWEEATGDMTRGRPVGILHAKEALNQLVALKVPASLPVYFSCDVNVTSKAQMDAVKAYLQGAASVLGIHRVGVYGERDVIDACVPSFATWGWQTYAWSSGIVSSKAHLYQYHNGQTIGGADCDFDRSQQDNFGAWFPAQKVHPMTAITGNLPTLSVGDDDAHYSGYNHVTRVQALLTGVWKKDLVIDGVYGAKTAAAAKAVLNEHTGTDGQHIGPKEWNVLYGL